VALYEARSVTQWSPRPHKADGLCALGLGQVKAIGLVQVVDLHFPGYYRTQCVFLIFICVIRLISEISIEKNGPTSISFLIFFFDFSRAARSPRKNAVKKHPISQKSIIFA
jgi:hypothetical protein